MILLSGLLRAANSLKRLKKKTYPFRVFSTAWYHVCQKIVPRNKYLEDILIDPNLSERKVTKCKKARMPIHCLSHSTYRGSVPWNDVGWCYMKQKQSEMTLRSCFGKHASQTVDFYCFKLFYAFLNDFETFYPFNVFFALTRFSVTSLLRYFV